jgi:hypothetical protein
MVRCMPPPVARLSARSTSARVDIGSGPGADIGWQLSAQAARTIVSDSWGSELLYRHNLLPALWAVIALACIASGLLALAHPHRVRAVGLTWAIMMVVAISPLVVFHDTVSLVSTAVESGL